jgi:hypothetical protein
MPELNNTPSKRVLRVYRGHHCSSRHHLYKPHPVIRLGGVYLSALDFQIGDRIEVAVRRGEIVITKVNV